MADTNLRILDRRPPRCIASNDMRISCIEDWNSQSRKRVNDAIGREIGAIKCHDPASLEYSLLAPSAQVIQLLVGFAIPP